MKVRRIRSISLLAALALMTMLSSGCVRGPLALTEAKIQPSASFLADLASESNAGAACGPNTREVVKDWISQNEPEYKE